MKLNHAKLIDLCFKDCSGQYGVPYSAEEYDTSKYRYLRISDITDDGFLHNNDLKSVSGDNLEAYLLKENDIVFARTGNSTGRSYMYDIRDGKLVYAGFLIKYSINPQKINPKYVRYFTQSSYYKQWVKNLSNGSTRGNINAQTFADCDIFFPERCQQDILVNELDSINDKISLNTRMNAELEAMAKQLYDYWFVQFDFPDENGKPYKSSGGKMVWNEKLKREIPEGWEVKEVDDCIQHINTGLNPRQNFVLGNGDIKYLTVKNLRSDGTIDFSNCDVIDEEARKKVHRRSDIRINDILFASIAPLGRCHLILKEPKDWDINESVFSIRPNIELVSPYYLFIYFMSNWFVQKAEKESAGSIFAGIRVNSLLNIPIIVPQNNIQNLFNEVVESNFIKRDSLSSEINHLTHLRDSLLPMLMNGQVTIE